MKHFIKAWGVASILAVVTGCTTYTEYEIYTGIATQNYARWTEQANRAPVDDSDNTIWIDFEDAKVQIYSPIRSEDVLAWGPIVPVIPDQEVKTGFGDKPFYIAVRIVPLESVVTFDPAEFAISVEGIDGPLVPIEIDDSLGDRNLQHRDANYSRQWVYGWQRYYWMSFDIKIKDVHRYTLTPGTMRVDGTLYVFPDILYEPFVRKDMR
jgi:hypothetical protein